MCRNEHCKCTLSDICFITCSLMLMLNLMLFSMFYMYQYSVRRRLSIAKKNDREKKGRTKYPSKKIEENNYKKYKYKK